MISDHDLVLPAALDYRNDTGHRLQPPRIRLLFIFQGKSQLCRTMCQTDDIFFSTNAFYDTLCQIVIFAHTNDHAFLPAHGTPARALTFFF